MYGVPSDLPLARLVDRDLDAITLCKYQICFRFDGGILITPTTAWELRDSTGTLLDSAKEHEQRESYRVHQIIGVPVSSFSIDAPVSFTLVFASGHRLTISDDGPQYESCTIDFEGEPTIII
jgi:hypothetical protein